MTPKNFGSYLSEGVSITRQKRLGVIDTQILLQGSFEGFPHEKLNNLGNLNRIPCSGLRHPDGIDPSCHCLNIKDADLDLYSASLRNEDS